MSRRKPATSYKAACYGNYRHKAKIRRMVRMGASWLAIKAMASYLGVSDNQLEKWTKRS